MIESKIDEIIFDRNTICIFGSIDQELADKVVKQILALKFKFHEECTPNPSIILLINSTGGITSGGMAIYDLLKSLKCKIITLCIGQAMSMAGLLLSGGTKGFRFALSNSDIMIHQPLAFGMQGQASDVMIHAERLQKLRKRLNEILAEHTGKPLNEIERDTERDYFMSACEAKDYGIIDKIIESIEEVYDEKLSC